MLHAHFWSSSWGDGDEWSGDCGEWCSEAMYKISNQFRCHRYVHPPEDLPQENYRAPKLCPWWSLWAQNFQLPLTLHRKGNGFHPPWLWRSLEVGTVRPWPTSVTNIRDIVKLQASNCGRDLGQTTKHLFEKLSVYLQHGNGSVEMATSFFLETPTLMYIPMSMVLLRFNFVFIPKNKFNFCHCIHLRKYLFCLVSFSISRKIFWKTVYSCINRLTLTEKMKNSGNSEKQGNTNEQSVINHKIMSGYKIIDVCRFTFWP